MKVLIFAFACDPDSGSEPGAGWAVVKAVASFADSVTVLTRTGGAPRLETAAGALSSDIRVIRLDCPRDQSSNVYIRYLSWILCARRFMSINRLWCDFDVVHHATYAADWFPTPFPRRSYGGARVWGPVGGATYPPISLLRVLPGRSRTNDLIRSGLTRALRFGVLRGSARSIDLALALNRDSERTLSRRLSVRVLQNAVVDYGKIPDAVATQPKSLVYFGRLVGWKGIQLVLDCFDLLDDSWSLTVIGDGPVRSTVEAFAATRFPRVTVLGSLPHEEALGVVASCAVAILPSLHDSAPWAAAEAAALGLPVVCLDLGGVSEMASSNAVVVESQPVPTLPRRLADAIESCSKKDWDCQRSFTSGTLAIRLAASYQLATLNAKRN